MVKSQERLDATFAALADPTRRAILAHLAQGERTVGELARPFSMSLPAVSKHLHVLERAGLLRQEKDGRLRLCRLHAAPLQDAALWLVTYRRFWETQLDALSRYLDQTASKEEPTWPPSNPSVPKPASRSAGRSPRPGSGSSGRGPGRKS